MDREALAAQPPLASQGRHRWHDRSLQGNVIVAATSTKECARCRNHTYAMRLFAFAKGPVRSGGLVVRQIASNRPVRAPLLRS